MIKRAIIWLEAFWAKMYLKHFSAFSSHRFCHLPPRTTLTLCQPSIVSKTMENMTKQYPFTYTLHSYPIYRQTHSDTSIYNGSSRHFILLYQITALYPIPIQSYSHTCEFHWQPTKWPKTCPKTLLLWLPQVHPLSYMSINIAKKW